jgi:phage terminase large subunit-like protein
LQALTLTESEEERNKQKLRRILKHRERERQLARAVDIADWAEREYYIADTQKPIKLLLFQKGLLRLVLLRDPDMYYRWTTCLWSSIKKTGKTSLTGLITRYIAECQTRAGQIICCGNDANQAAERAFLFAADSIRLNPATIKRSSGHVLPGRWQVQATKMKCTSTGTVVRAIGVDAPGEAGGNPSLSVWCVTPDTPILTADLRYLPAGELKKGAKLVGFEEESPSYNCSRRYKTATVTAFQRKPLPCMEIEIEGDIPLRATPNHRWLVRNRGQNVMIWRRTDELRVGDEIGQILPTWKADETYDAGYVAGAFDGEGHLSALKEGNGYSLGVSQIEGKYLLEKVQDVLRRGHFRPTFLREMTRHALNPKPMGRLRIDRLADIVRLLGTFRPLRLLSQFTPDQMGHIRGSVWRKIVSVQDVGLQEMACISTDTKTYVARGYAAHNTELWGLEDRDALRFWEEMTPVPTREFSIRLVETYVGYEGESKTLYDLWVLGKSGHQIKNDEFARLVSRDVDGERYEDFLYAFEETQGDPDALLPIWFNDAARMFMYYDEGLTARRLPWLKGVRGEAYYREEEKVLAPRAFRRLHYNQWVGAESAFVPIEAWDRCFEEGIQPLQPGDKTPCVMGVDAATTGDCFGIVLVSRHPDPARHMDIAVRACKVWSPEESGGRINYEDPENFIRLLVYGGCVLGHPIIADIVNGLRTNVRGSREADCPACRDKQFIEPLNIQQLCYDPYQLEAMMQKLRREQVVWCKPFQQTQPRLIADSMLYDLIINRRIAHYGDLKLRQHIQNANAKLEKDQDSKMRMCKKQETLKIDLAVALSMAVFRCLHLQL